MLVTFSSSATSDLVMFSDVARHLLELLGKAPTALGVLTPSEFPEALHRLQKIPPGSAPHLENDTARDAAGKPAAETGVEAHHLVGLDVRAHPFAGMIRQAGAEKAPILWRSDADFFAEP